MGGQLRLGYSLRYIRAVEVSNVVGIVRSAVQSSMSCQ